MPHGLSAPSDIGHTTTLTYDALSRLTSETQPVTSDHAITTSFGYDATGNETHYTDGRSESPGWSGDVALILG